MFRVVRRILPLLAAVLGLAVTAAGPASAGMILNNHCEPTALPSGS
jgi:hypothetical protein